MREIRQSGSEGGAVMSRPYPYRVEIVATFEGHYFQWTYCFCSEKLQRLS